MENPAAPSRVSGRLQKKPTGSLWTWSSCHVSPLIQAFYLLLSAGWTDDSHVSFLVQSSSYVSSVHKVLFPTYTTRCRNYLLLCYKYANSFSQRHTSCFLFGPCYQDRFQGQEWCTELQLKLLMKCNRFKKHKLVLYEKTPFLVTVLCSQLLREQAMPTIG